MVAFQMESPTTQCAESVYSGPWSNRSQCARKAGYGPESKYCHQHAEKFIEGETVTWYRTSTWSDYSLEIKAVDVIKEDDKTLLIRDGNKTCREKKDQQYYTYFKTRAEAVGFYRKRIAGIHARADDMESKLI